MKRSRSPEELPPLESHGPSGDAASLDTETASEPVAKVVELDEDAQDAAADVMKCSLPPHKEVLSFRSYDEWEAHFSKLHTNRCLECRKNFPSAHLLGVHIEECHDAFMAVKRERGEHTYSCFVEGCERMCRTPQKRRLHLIDKHMYPKNFFFAVTREGIDGRRSLLVESGHHRRRSSNSFTATKDQRRRSSILEASSSTAAGSSAKPPAKERTEASSSDAIPPKDTKKEEEEERDEDADMKELTGAMSALQFVPSSVRFGRGGGRVGFSKR